MLQQAGLTLARQCFCLQHSCKCREQRLMHVALHLWCPACTLILKQLAYNAVCSPVLSRSLSPSLSLSLWGALATAYNCMST